MTGFSPTTPIISALCLVAIGSACSVEPEPAQASTFREAPTATVRNAIFAGTPEATDDARAIRDFVAVAAAAYQGERPSSPAAFIKEHPELAEMFERLPAINATWAAPEACPSSDRGCATAPREGDDGHDPGRNPNDSGADGGHSDDGGADSGGSGGTGGPGGGDDGGGDDGGGPPGEECDLPYVPRPIIRNCAGGDVGEVAELQAAYKRAHYNMWRFHQLLEHVLTLHHDVGQAEAEVVWKSGDESDVSLSYYFGDYDVSVITALEETVRYVRENYLTHDGSVTLACYEEITFGDLFQPQLLAAKLASSCLWGDTMAHSVYVGLPFLHPNYTFPTYEICDTFFTTPGFSEPPEQGMIVSHEFFHWLENDFGVLKDRFNVDACKINAGGGKQCSEPNEINALAVSHQDLAMRNVHGYAMFGLAYSDLYMNDECESGFCFDAPWCPDEDEGGDGGGGGAPPPPPECDGEQLGTCPHGLCAPIEQSPSYAQKVDPFSEAHPDGDFSKDTYCEGADLVCARVGDEGRCLPCGPGNMLGCPCASQNDCDLDGLGCWGTTDAGWNGSQGFCWDPVEGPPPFQCDEGCTGRTDYLGNDAYYCYHDTNVVDKATCVHTDCANPDAFCAYTNIELVCDGSDCEPECLWDADCGDEFGWPIDTACSGARCVPPAGP